MKCRQKDVEALFQRVSNASAAVRATDLEKTPPATSKNVATNRLQRCKGGVTKSRRLPRADAEAASVVTQEKGQMDENESDSQRNRRVSWRTPTAVTFD